MTDLDGQLEFVTDVDAESADQDGALARFLLSLIEDQEDKKDNTPAD